MQDKKLTSDKFIELNNIGFEFKKDYISKPVTDRLIGLRVIFCSDYCKYFEECSHLEEHDMPWCPIGEL